MLEIVSSGLNVNFVCALGWMACACTPLDVILCCLLLSRKSITSPAWKRRLQSFFLLPGLSYHSSIVRNISSVSFQLTNSLLTVPINQLLDRLLILSSRNDTSVSIFVLVRGKPQVSFRNYCRIPRPNRTRY